jgi:hypothetical protein
MTIHEEEMDGSHEEGKNNDPSKVNGGSPCSSDASSVNSPKANEVRRTNNVSELVAKSKKAASSLWTLLHAKVRCSRTCVGG